MIVTLKVLRSAVGADVSSSHAKPKRLLDGRRERRKDLSIDLSEREQKRLAPSRVRTVVCRWRKIRCVSINRRRPKPDQPSERNVLNGDQRRRRGQASAVVSDHVRLSWRGTRTTEHLTSTNAPHPSYNAILRNSLLSNILVMQSNKNRDLAVAKPTAATALLEFFPTALLLRTCYSQGKGSGLGTKSPRILVSIFPARAGMNRSDCADSIMVSYVPRACGDEPRPIALGTNEILPSAVQSQHARVRKESEPPMIDDDE